MLVIDRFEGAWAVIEDNRDTFITTKVVLKKKEDVLNKYKN